MDDGRDPAGVLLDLSGVLYLGDEAFAGAPEALEVLRGSGLPVAFVTNVTRTPRARLLEGLAAMGLELDADALFTAPQAARDHLRRNGLTPHLLVHPDLEPELADLVGGRAPDAVLVGDAGDAFTYERLNGALRVLVEGAPLLAMGRTRYFQSPQGLCLDAGPFVAALEFAAGVEATVLGKPSPAFFEAAVRHLGVPAERVVMIGDDARSDVLAALDAGLGGVLVRTGKFRPGDDATVEERGARVADGVRQAVEMLLGR